MSGRSKILVIVGTPANGKRLADLLGVKDRAVVAVGKRLASSPG